MRRVGQGAESFHEHSFDETTLHISKSLFKITPTLIHPGWLGDTFTQVHLFLHLGMDSCHKKIEAGKAVGATEHYNTACYILTFSVCNSS